MSQLRPFIISNTKTESSAPLDSESPRCSYGDATK